MKMTLDSELSAEAKALVALAFRNGPIEAAACRRAMPDVPMAKLMFRTFSTNK